MHGFAQKMGFHLIYKQGYKGTALTVALLCFALMFDICSHNRIPQCALCPFLAAPGPLLILLIASSANLTIRPTLQDPVQLHCWGPTWPHLPGRLGCEADVQ